MVARILMLLQIQGCEDSGFTAVDGRVRVKGKVKPCLVSPGGALPTYCIVYCSTDL